MSVQFKHRTSSEKKGDVYINYISTHRSKISAKVKFSNTAKKVYVTVANSITFFGFLTQTFRFCYFSQLS